MTINTGDYPKLLWPGVKGWYGLEYKAYSQQHLEIFEKRESTKAYEEIVGQTGFGLASVKPEGSAVSYDTSTQGFTSRFTNLTLGLGFIITREMFEDDQYNQVGMMRSKALATSARITKETFGANVLSRGFNPSYAGGDGASLLSNAHKNKSGGTFSNILAVAADFSEAALEQACIDLGKFEDDRGLRIMVKPKKVILPVDLQFEGERVLNTDLRVATADNDLNAIKSLGKVPGGFVINNFLSDPKAWFLQTDCSDGLIYFERRADEFEMDNDFDTGNGKYKYTGRYSHGWADGGRAIIGSPGV